MNNPTHPSADQNASNRLALRLMTPARLRAGLAAALVSLAGPVAAFEIEGPLSDIGSDYIVCNGAKVRINSATQFFSPSGPVPSDQLASINFPNAGVGFNGVARAGFKLGTCIASGDDATGLASSVFVEIAENVIVGNTTHAPGEPLAILGVRIEPLADGRMTAAKPPAGMYDAYGVNNHPKEVARNQFGFGVRLASVPAQDFAAAEGYLSAAAEQKVLYAHTIETTGGEPELAYPRASLQRAQCRNEPGGGRDQVEILGSCILPAGVTSQRLSILVRDATGGVQPLKTSATAVAVATCTADPASPGYGVYRFRNDRLDLRLSDPKGIDTCPANFGVSLNGTALYDWTPGDNR